MENYPVPTAIGPGWDITTAVAQALFGTHKVQRHDGVRYVMQTAAGIGRRNSNSFIEKIRDTALAAAQAQRTLIDPKRLDEQISSLQAQASRAMRAR